MSGRRALIVTVPQSAAGGWVTGFGTVNAPQGVRHPSEALLNGGGTTLSMCLESEITYTYYLYDNGVLVATFDDDDNELELFVNGPEGMIASYHNNDQEYLYLYVKDQVGSPRITMHQPFLGIHCQMVHYTNYHPFGGVLESSGSFASAFKFSGKEHDDESSFDYHYFGARYYDARLGTFSSIDKAGQFSSGYLYGGNNPISTYDPDGNVAFLLGVAGAALHGAIFSAVSYTIVGLPATGFKFDEWASGLDDALLNGAVSGGVGGALSAVPTMGASKGALGAIRNAAATGTSSAILGDGVNLKNIGFSTIGELGVQSLMAPYQPTSTNGLRNMIEEVAYSGIRGGVSGLISGTMHSWTTEGVEARSVLRDRILAGAVGGAGSALARNAIMGWARVSPDAQVANRMERMSASLDIKPTFRTGGLMALGYNIAGKIGFGWVQSQLRSQNFGLDSHLDPGDASMTGKYVGDVMVHEAYHLYLAQEQGLARSWGITALQGFFAGLMGQNVYRVPGTNEWLCVQAQKIF